MCNVHLDVLARAVRSRSTLQLPLILGADDQWAERVAVAYTMMVECCVDLIGALALAAQVIDGDGKFFSPMNHMTEYFSIIMILLKG